VIVGDDIPGVEALPSRSTKAATKTDRNRMVYQDKERQLKGGAEAKRHCLCIAKRERRRLGLRKAELRHGERFLRTGSGLQSRQTLRCLLLFWYVFDVSVVTPKSERSSTTPMELETTKNISQY
jgi:hypothetical protein